MTRLQIALSMLVITALFSACERQDYSDSRAFSRHGLDEHGHGGAAHGAAGAEHKPAEGHTTEGHGAEAKKH